MTVAIVGGGQLARMLALAGHPLGIPCRVLDPTADPPAAVAAPALRGALDDPADLARLAQGAGVLTFDWENVSVGALRGALRAAGVRAAPPVAALATAQDRVAEKRLFERLGIRTTRWQAVDSWGSLERAVAAIGLPGVLKTRRLGYDGKGQAVLRDLAGARAVWESLGSAPLIYEELVGFEFEVSVIGARSRRGEIVVYPLNGNAHAGGILRLTRAPFGTPALQRAAAASLRRVLGHFRYTGILCIEFFVRRGRLIANEMAPRVHNSGHWTIEGAETSQFENHLRAILGLPLGSTRPRGHAAMINLIGSMPPRAGLLAVPGLHLHSYGKSPRPGRKLGHLTFLESSASRRDARARALLEALAPQVRVP